MYKAQLLNQVVGLSVSAEKPLTRVFLPCMQNSFLNTAVIVGL